MYKPFFNQGKLSRLTLFFPSFLYSTFHEDLWEALLRIAKPLQVQITFAHQDDVLRLLR